MRRPAALALALLAVLAGALPAGPGHAQSINRCTGADGTTIYTDRRCSDIGAVTRPQRAGMAAAAPRAYRGCARNVQDLVHEVSAAIDGRDVNRLAGVYHFAGMSSRSGHHVMDRLDTIVQRPLVGIVPVQAETPAPVQAAGYGASTFPPLATAASARRRPVALRLEQTVGDRITPRGTMLGLRRHMGCWWVSL
ncbi:DUF4124 domain-containing protein [Luteimonas yindakuii]|uniref:DUF4124 domain-containing protein n=1 Tax=Luteimonas yindakuii TaxID=2565782 RepID=A0A4Z1QZT2_9GAMM|nr:DUF4124 domain-containing protein [Luteimonas yindakuii]TKS52780.1 DUF4124 domain-containing protein [Luteimonas yindakuii]